MVKKDLSTDRRNNIVQFILGECINGSPPRGKLKEARLKFGISRNTVSRLWTAAKLQRSKGLSVHLVSAKKHTPKVKKLQLDHKLLTSIDVCKRGSMRQLAVGLGVSKTTVWRWVKKGELRAHTSALKPALTMPNKLHRMRFSLEALELDLELKRIMFKNMHNIVHIDEKWFYITKGSHRFYLAPEEEDPHRTCKSKTFITKIMFMCAVARPIFSPSGEILFDGKIGMFPFTEMVPAKRKSKNRDKGTLEVKPIQSITKLVIKDCLINQIIPAIMAKWPKGASKEIMIQQDNARPHVSDSDADFRAAATLRGFNMRLVQQPPNSPDCNVNDLGWFASIQSLQVQTASNTMQDLLNAVTNSFIALSPHTLNDVFLSLQGCMIEILKLKGENRYKVPHLGKEALKRTGNLPLCLEVPVELAIQCINYLKEKGSNEGLDAIVQHLQIEGS